MGAADRARNKADRLTGKAKRKLGRVIGDREMENQGTLDEITANIKDAAHDVKDAFRRR